MNQTQKVGKAGEIDGIKQKMLKKIDKGGEIIKPCMTNEESNSGMKQSCNHAIA